jgi:anaerobic ribonucleoside-triphosphate reductase activating protein
VRCPGCFNPHLWAASGGRLENTVELAVGFVADAERAGALGITLLGGEPFDQAAGLATIAEAFRAAGLSVMTFTGYTLDRLTGWAATRPDIARLLAATDLLVDGPYLRDQPDAVRPWLGSTNQASARSPRCTPRRSPGSNGRAGAPGWRSASTRTAGST